MSYWRYNVVPSGKVHERAKTAHPNHNVRPTLTKLNNEETVLRVHIADDASVLVPREGQRNKFEMQSLTRVTWYNHGLRPNPKPTEFRAIPIDILDLPQEIDDFNHIPSEYERASWYFLERSIRERGVPNEYIVHGDDLIPLNASYPALISMLPRLQEMLAVAQLETAKLAQKPELRLGVADRLMAHLTGIAVNVTPR